MSNVGVRPGDGIGSQQENAHQKNGLIGQLYEAAEEPARSTI